MPQFIGIIYDYMPKEDRRMLWQVALGSVSLFIVIACICFMRVKENKEIAPK